MTRRNGGAAIAVLAEVAAVLARHGQMPCAPEVIEEDGLVTLTVTLRPQTTAQALEQLEVLGVLQYVVDVGQMRALAEKYGIDPVLIEAVLQESEARE